MRLVWIISKEIEIARSNVFLIFGHFEIYFYLNRKWSATWRYLLTTLLFEIASHHIRAWHCLILNLGWKKKQNSTTSHWPRKTTYQGKLLVKWSPPSLPTSNLKFLFITSHALCGLLVFIFFSFTSKSHHFTVCSNSFVTLYDGIIL